MVASHLCAFVLVVYVSHCGVALASGGCLWGVEQTCKDLWSEIASDVKCISASQFADNKQSCCERMAKASTCFASNPPKNKPESTCTLGMHVQTTGYTSSTLYNLKPVPNHLSTCGCCPEFKCEIAWYAAKKELPGCTKAGHAPTPTPTTPAPTTPAPTPAPTPKGPTTPAPTPAPVLTVSGVLVIAMENASKLLKNAEGLAAFKKALKRVIAELLNMGLVKEYHIKVDIAQSSGDSRRLSSSSAKGLKATYTITVPKGAEATKVATRINSKSTEDLKTAVDSALIETAQAVPDMKGLTSSGVINIAQGSLSASTFTPDVSAGGRATAHGAVIVSVSLLGAMTSLMTSK